MLGHLSSWSRAARHPGSGGSGASAAVRFERGRSGCGVAVCQNTAARGCMHNPRLRWGVRPAFAQVTGTTRPWVTNPAAKESDHSSLRIGRLAAVFPEGARKPPDHTLRTERFRVNSLKLRKPCRSRPYEQCRCVCSFALAAASFEAFRRDARCRVEIFIGSRETSRHWGRSLSRPQVDIRVFLVEMWPGTSRAVTKDATVTRPYANRAKRRSEKYRQHDVLNSRRQAELRRTSRDASRGDVRQISLVPWEVKSAHGSRYP